MSQDTLLGRIALNLKMITEEALFEAVLAQEYTHKPLGEILVDRRYITREQLHDLLRFQQEERQKMSTERKHVPGSIPLGQLLVDLNLITEYQLNECLRTQAKFSELGINPVPHLGEILLRKGYISEEVLTAALQKQSHDIYFCPDCNEELATPEKGKQLWQCGRCGAKIPEIFVKLAAGFKDKISVINRSVEIPEEVKLKLHDPDAQFGKYVIISEIGRGGAGVVYLAWQKEMNRKVALKVLSHDSRTSSGVMAPLGDKEDLVRFFAEGRAAGKLKHPNIVPIIDFGIHRQQVFYVFKYVEGLTLDDYVLNKKIGHKESARIIWKLCIALDYAHRNGVYHRDIKPSNIIMDKRDEPHLLDFGLAKVVALGDPAYVKGVIMGTPYYMPPEQASGDMEKVDNLSDIYSIGAVLYELVTRRCPYFGKSPDQVLDIISSTPPDRPSSLVEIDPFLEMIILKAMARRKADRYQSPVEMADDLMMYLKGDVTARVPAQKQKKRNILDSLLSIFKRK